MNAGQTRANKAQEMNAHTTTQRLTDLRSRGEPPSPSSALSLRCTLSALSSRCARGGVSLVSVSRALAPRRARCRQSKYRTPADWLWRGPSRRAHPSQPGSICRHCVVLPSLSAPPSLRRPCGGKARNLDAEGDAEGAAGRASGLVAERRTEQRTWRRCTPQTLAGVCAPRHPPPRAASTGSAAGLAVRSPRGRLCCSGTEPDAEPLPVPAPWAPARVLRPRMRSWQICDRRRVRGCVVRSKGGEPERAQTARGRASECICGALQAQNPPACHTRRRRRAPCALARSRKTCCNHDASVHGSLRPSAFRTSRTGCLTARDGRVVARARMRTRARARTHTHTHTHTHRSSRC